MPGQRTLPGLGLTGFWDLGSDDWKPGMDANLRILSAVARGWVKSRSTTLPAPGVTGDIYLVPADDPTNANQIAIWDGASGAEDWVFVAPVVGQLFLVADTDKLVRWDGTAWIGAFGGGIARHVALTQAQYDALGTKDAETFYLITDAI